MKLTIGHKEIVAGIVMFLDSRGVKGFNPETVHADFSLTRGDNRQLSCTLDEDAPVASVQATEAPKPSVAVPATTSAPVAQRQETVPVADAAPTEQAAPEAEAAVAEAVAVIEEASVTAAEPEAENLFG